MPWSCQTSQSCVIFNPSAGATRAAFASTAVSACKDFIKRNATYTHFVDHTEWTIADGGSRCYSCDMPLQVANAVDEDTRMCHWRAGLEIGTIVGIVLGISAGFAMFAALLYLTVCQAGNGPSARPVVKRQGFSTVPTDDEFPETMPRLNLRI